MFDVVFPKFLRKARKEHIQSIDYCFENVTKWDYVNKISLLDEVSCKDIGMNWNEIQIIKQSLNNKWKIFPGEKYYTWSGVNSDWFWTIKVSIKIYDIINKYNLWPEY